MKQFIPLTIQVDRLARRFKTQFQHGISIDPTRSVEVNGRLTPLLRSGNATLNMDFSMPDQFSADTGEGATIFVRTGSDFVRVTTSVKKPNGERPLGTSLDRAHPGYASLMAGRPYVGYATLFGIQYMTRYDPIFDAHNKVIGILYVGIDVSAYTPMGVSAKISLFVFVSSSVVLTLMMWSFSAAMMPGGAAPVDPYALRNQYLMLSLLPLALMALVRPGPMELAPVYIARKHGRTPTQVALAWLLGEDGVAAIPKAASEANQRANLEAASLRLDDEDRRAIAGLPKNRRLVDPDFAPDWDA